MSLNILYLGSTYGTSLHRAQALRRLGHRVNHIDPNAYFPKGFIFRIIQKIIYGIGGWIFEGYIRYFLLNALKEDKKFDLVWVNGGELIGPKTVIALHRIAQKIINYNNDDPFGERDKHRFDTYRKALSQYDLVVVLRQVNINEAISQGARNVVRVFFSADEIEHAPLILEESDIEKWSSEVVFVGTWMPERGPFIARLLELGVPIKIYGDRWNKAEEWPRIRKAWAGPNLIGAEYVKAIQCAKVSLGLLSKGNRDYHTTRSSEIPYIGSVLCAERTIEHKDMYSENLEAVFWSTPEECAERCFFLLNNDERRESIAHAGRRRCIRDKYLNEEIAKKIINQVYKI